MLSLQIKPSNTQEYKLCSKWSRVISTMLTHSCLSPQLLIEYERGSFSLKLLSLEEVNEVVAQIGNCLLRICPGLSPRWVLTSVCSV